MTPRTQELGDILVALVDPVCRAHGVELVDVRYQRERGGAVVRIIIDRQVPGQAEGSGVSLEDCTRVSRDVSTVLDVHDGELPAGAYRLEVSSPGLERPLVRLTDFERFAGREVKVRMRSPLEGRRRFHGTLRGVVRGQVELEEGEAVYLIPHEDIAHANLVYRFTN